MGIRRTNGCAATLEKLTKLFACAVAIAAALALLSACARQGRPRPLPESMRISAGTPVPTGIPADASASSPTTSVEPAGELLTPTLPVGDPGPSVSAAAIPAASGETGTYTVTIRGLGRDTSAGIVSTGVLSSGVLPLQPERSRPVCGRDGRSLNCSLGDLQGGEAATVTLDLSVPGTETLITGIVGPVDATATAGATDLVVQASGPSTVTTGQPVTFTYTVSNLGESIATGVYFEDVIPSDMDLVAYAPGLPDCGQEGDSYTCILRDPDAGEPVTFTLIITGYGDQPMIMGLDRLQPGWPICTVLKERTWLHIAQCELGDLKPGQATHVQLVLTAVGVVERTTANTASVRANEPDLHPLDNAITTTIAIRSGAAPGGD